MTILNDTIRRLLDQPNPAVLGTVNPDDGSRTRLIRVCRDGDDVPVSTAAGRRKERDLRRDSRGGLAVHDPRDPRICGGICGVTTSSVDVGRALVARRAEEYEGSGTVREYPGLPPEAVRVVPRIAPNKAVGSATE